MFRSKGLHRELLMRLSLFFSNPFQLFLLTSDTDWIQELYGPPTTGLVMVSLYVGGVKKWAILQEFAQIPQVHNN